MSSELHARIEALIASGPVVLFMKGNRRAPQCGFSAKVVDILDDLLPDYRTVDVLSDPEVREGIKSFSDWPTIPQLYVKGAFVGGSDIVAEMHQNGELAPLLGADPRDADVEAPEIRVTESAVKAFVEFAATPRPKVRLQIGRDFAPELDLEEPLATDIVVEAPGLVIGMDKATARRADGLVIDYVEREGGGGFRIDNPNAPPTVKKLSVAEYARWRKEAKPHLLLDVRTEAERDVATIDESTLITGGAGEILDELDRATTLVLFCHHGFRSRAAGEHCIRLGFRDVYNLEGGIDAWSQEIDPKVPRY